MLEDVDHGYIGIQDGIGLNIGGSKITNGDQSIELIEPNTVSLDFNRGISFIGTTKLFIGYSYKKHKFETTLGFILDRVNFTALNQFKLPFVRYHFEHRYTTLGLRYYYEIPEKIKGMKLLAGVEAGVAFRGKLPIIESFNDGNGNIISIGNKNIHLTQFYMGIHPRMDIKIVKNVSLVLQSSVLFMFQYGELYDLSYVIVGDPVVKNFTIASSVINLNFHAGLKFDFYSHKTKLNHYKKLGVKDPYSDIY